MNLVIRYLEWRLKKPRHEWNEEDIARIKRGGQWDNIVIGLSLLTLYLVC